MPCAQAAEIFPLAANLVAVFPIARMAPRAAAFAFFFGVASFLVTPPRADQSSGRAAKVRRRVVDFPGGEL